MKRYLSFLILAAALLLGACATPLGVAKDSGRFAQTLGISTGDVLFLNFCYFGKSPKGQKPRLKRIDGVVVATPARIHLLNENVPANGEPQSTSLEYAAMQSVAHIQRGLGCQIEIRSADDIIVLSLTRDPFFDCQGSRSLFAFIVARGVPVVEAMGWHDFLGTGGMAPLVLGF